ncbi:thermonuclease family protein [Methylocystis sp. H62]|uniref:thermonuclease family protein n=1 Tax=Methylocystis sp. H62 TaxID=2785789 RepID=UPI001FEDA897|nr:nuclease [Methylocystis sp. H62]
MAVASFVATAWPSCAEPLPPAAETGECSLEGAVPATVAAVDEDFELLLDDGRRAALAGLDFPPPEMAELRAAIRSRLSSWLAGRDIFLGAVATLDRWGRAPARIYASPADGGDAAPLTSVAAALLSAGEARFRPDPTAAACAKAYLAAEAPAREGGVGLWSRPEFRPIDVSAPGAVDDLKRRKGMMVVVGAIRSVGESRRAFYLNFGDKWRDSFTVVILRRNLAVFGQIEPRSLVGRRARVRGLIETGARIEIATPAEIEFVDGFPSR